MTFCEQEEDERTSCLTENIYIRKGNEREREIYEFFFFFAGWPSDRCIVLLQRQGGMCLEKKKRKMTFAGQLNTCILKTRGRKSLKREAYIAFDYYLDMICLYEYIYIYEQEVYLYNSGC